MRANKQYGLSKYENYSVSFFSFRFYGPRMFGHVLTMWPMGRFCNKVFCAAPCLACRNEWKVFVCVPIKNRLLVKCVCRSVDGIEYVRYTCARVCKSLNLRSLCRSSTTKLHALTDWATEPRTRFDEESKSTRNLIHHHWTRSTLWMKHTQRCSRRILQCAVSTYGSCFDVH